MYRAIIESEISSRLATLGPTDTRDEAARLARAWMESHPVAPNAVAGRRVAEVRIERVE